MPGGLLLHLLYFMVLGVFVSAVVSAYRDEDPRAILRGTRRRFLKFAGFSLILALAMMAFEWFVFSSA